MDDRSIERDLSLMRMPTPVKALATCIIITLAFGMVGALGQIFVHDIIPTFFSNDGQVVESHSKGREMEMKPPAGETAPSGRGDLFSDLSPVKAKPKRVPVYKNAQFVWTLKWTHIHLFGMNAIFILMGAITLGLNTSARARTWLVVLPFAGVLIDILAMWLKGFVSPIFFWLHVPGGGIFAVVFFYVSTRALLEMWGRPKSEAEAPLIHDGRTANRSFP